MKTEETKLSQEAHNIMVACADYLVEYCKEEGINNPNIQLKGTTHEGGIYRLVFERVD